MFAVSYLVVCCFVALQGFATQAILRETLAHVRARKASAGSMPAPAVAVEVPEFRLLDLESTEAVSAHDLKRGHRYMLLFVHAVREAVLPPPVFWTMVSGLLHNIEVLYLVCQGEVAECRILLERAQSGQRPRIPIKVLIDGENKLAPRCGIATTPAAVLIDSEGLLSKVGKATFPIEVYNSRVNTSVTTYG
jgi:hypothetical protein